MSLLTVCHADKRVFAASLKPTWGGRNVGSQAHAAGLSRPNASSAA